jgi:hypothetical protein
VLRLREYMVKTVKIGDSVAVALPRELLAAEHISENMDVKITVQKCPKDVLKGKGSSLGDDPWRLLE